MSDSPKIIIDEDWKTQVQAEKEAAKQGGPESNPEAKTAPDETAAPQASTGDPSSPEDAAFPEDPEMPPASFEMLLTGLATEAMMAMGQIPHPVTGEASVHPNQAKYLIDTIEVLRDKTKGNLGPGEGEAIDGLLHQLRMAFVATTR
jgi:hypothetical protein